MNLNKFFLEASKQGLEASEISTGASSSLSISLFHGEISQYSNSKTSSVVARGIYNGQFGLCVTEKDTNDSINYLINGIKETASLIETKDEAILFKGSEKYSKKNVFNKELENWDPKDILIKLHELEDKLKNADPLISEVEVMFEKATSEYLYANSYGLRLKSKSNYYYVYASAIMKQGEEIKDHGKLFVSSDIHELNVDAIVEEIVTKCKAKFNGESIKAGTYKAVLNTSSVASLVNALVSNLSSEETQKHSSVFEGKVGEKVLSSKLTITEEPLRKNFFFNYFDDEGVATYNKKVIEKGVIKTLFYNLLTAKKDGVESTGNASRRGSKMGISFNNLVVKPGRLTEDQLFEKIENGVYITSIQGLHAGLNAKSGDFSLQAEGFKVENGKISKPLTLITASGNLFKLFNSIIAVGNNSELLLSSVTTPSIAFRGIKISAE